MPGHHQIIALGKTLLNGEIRRKVERQKGFEPSALSLGS